MIGMLTRKDVNRISWGLFEVKFSFPKWHKIIEKNWKNWFLENYCLCNETNKKRRSVWETYIPATRTPICFFQGFLSTNTFDNFTFDSIMSWWRGGILAYEKTRVKFNFVLLVVTYVFDNVSFYWHLLIMLSILLLISVIIHLQNITYVI